MKQAVQNHLSSVPNFSFVHRKERAIGLQHQLPHWAVVSVAQLVARRTHDRKVVGSIPTNAVCFTVVR